MEGWIKLYRKLLDNPIVCKDSETFSIWLYLLLNATYQEIPAVFKGKKITLRKGQLITGILSISKKLKINKDKVQRTLKCFEIDKQIEQETSNKNRLISILNWEQYQDNDNENDKQMINKCETNDKQLITNKNIKNIKNDKNIITTIDDSCVDGLQDVIDFYQDNIGLITPYTVEVFTDYAKEMPEDLIIYAMQISVEANKRTIQYIKAILNNWQKAGIKTLVDAKKDNHKNCKSNFTGREYSPEELSSLYANL